MSLQSRTNISENCPALQSLTPEDRSIFCKFSVGPSEAPLFPTIIAAFEANVIRYPHNIAAEIVGPCGSLIHGKRITYCQLNTQATRLAGVLVRRGVSRGDLVGLFLRRGIEMLVGILGVLKVGAAYIPQDALVAPAHQLLHIVQNAEARVVLTTAGLESSLPRFGESVHVLAVDTVMRSTEIEVPVPLVSRQASPSDVCYVIFTSGTTGVPKGVQVTHKNAANILLTRPMNLGMGPGIRVSQILSISFDMGAWEMLGSLSNAATLVIRHSSISDAVKHADIVISTPTVLDTLVSSQMRHIKCVAVAGEPCPRQLADEWSSFCKFYNACGPTETTIVNTAKLHSADAQTLSIGAPTPNNTVYVLDQDTREPLAIGAVGEMWAGGACVSSGYLGKPELTAAKYVYDPFVDDGNSVMFKTGDLGRWNSDGELEHLGRVDDQVKIKGFRVELDGVASSLESAASVRKAVALKIGEEIMAVVTPNTANVGRALAAVRDHLPYYCVPSSIVALRDIPETGNGKADKRELAKMIHAMTSTGRGCLTRNARSCAETARGTSNDVPAKEEPCEFRGVPIYQPRCQLSLGHSNENAAGHLSRC